ncbi:MAG: DoxX family membrane protein [Candidatus Omnitrophica bacterium]|nr:DoxX family membrane protein [Candidatus Omnitrophota bacterium]
MGLIFFYAGLSKLLEPVENFRGVIAQYQVIPYERVGAIALILPWIELVFGTFLILGYWETVSAAVLGTVTLGFLLILGSSNVLLEGGGDCGCFGANSPIHLSPRQVFAMDFLNFLICIKLYLRKRTPWSLDTFFRRAR